MSGARNFLDEDSLRAKTFVRHVEIHDRLPSTNDRAIELSAAGDLVTPALIVASLQTAGRGRGEHAWWSADGALTFSLILDTAGWGITQRDWPRLSLTTAVAVCDALRHEVAPPRLQQAGSSARLSSPQASTPAAPVARIKWPNDVLLDGQKVGGILIESPGGPPPAKNRLIIGVGVNVNNSWRDAPHEAGPAGIALCDVTGKQHDIQAILVAILDAMQSRLRQLAANDSALPEAWQQLCWLTEQDVVAERDGQQIEGRCLGIADDGALLVQTLFTTERIYSGSVRVK